MSISDLTSVAVSDSVKSIVTNTFTNSKKRSVKTDDDDSVSISAGVTIKMVDFDVNLGFNIGSYSENGGSQTRINTNIQVL